VSSGHQNVRKVATGLAGTGVAATFVHLVPGVVAWRSARTLLLPRLSGVGRRDHVALTFDDGPDPVATPLVLDALDELEWRATFFCLGSQADRYPDLVREIADRGHELGVHGYEHKSHLWRSAPALIHDLARARSTLEDLSGQPMRWFRPPYGGVSASSIVASRRHRFRMILWTTWGIDWKPESTGETVAANVRRTFVPGATVLLHDSDITSTPQSWNATVAALPLMADSWNNEGLEVGPLRDHF
jgi:peptidoglycan/xylan/chitin deacetylase (PgdA/CDA1 family)